MCPPGVSVPQVAMATRPGLATLGKVSKAGTSSV